MKPVRMDICGVWVRVGREGGGAVRICTVDFIIIIIAGCVTSSAQGSTLRFTFRKSVEHFQAECVTWFHSKNWARNRPVKASRLESKLIR
jgi:hypothetical protein